MDGATHEMSPTKDKTSFAFKLMVDVSEAIVTLQHRKTPFDERQRGRSASHPVLVIPSSTACV
jgi:hypothetical protein